MKRDQAIESIFKTLPRQDITVSTTGLISREIFEKYHSSRNIYIPGSMGISSTVGLGLALTMPESRIEIIDGDEVWNEDRAWRTLPSAAGWKTRSMDSMWVIPVMRLTHPRPDLPPYPHPYQFLHFLQDKPPSRGREIPIEGRRPLRGRCRGGILRRGGLRGGQRWRYRGRWSRA